MFKHTHVYGTAVEIRDDMGPGFLEQWLGHDIWAMATCNVEQLSWQNLAIPRFDFRGVIDFLICSQYA